MTQHERDSIFYLLYAMVLIDNRVIKVEMDMFFAIIEDFLTAIFNSDVLTAKSTISNWFIQNYKNILKEVRSPIRESYLMEHVEALKNYDKTKYVFEMMREIAISDDEYHKEERMFLQKAADIWGLNTDPLSQTNI